MLSMFFPDPSLDLGYLRICYRKVPLRSGRDLSSHFWSASETEARSKHNRNINKLLVSSVTSLQ